MGRGNFSGSVAGGATKGILFYALDISVPVLTRTSPLTSQPKYINDKTFKYLPIYLPFSFLLEQGESAFLGGLCTRVYWEHYQSGTVLLMMCCWTGRRGASTESSTDRKWRHCGTAAGAPRNRRLACHTACCRRLLLGAAETGVLTLIRKQII